MTSRPTARRDLRIEARAHLSGEAWVVRVPGDATRYWFGPEEIAVLRALDGHHSLDALVERIARHAEGGGPAIRALVSRFEQMGFLEPGEPSDAVMETQVAHGVAGQTQEASFWGQLRAVPLEQVAHLLVDLPGATTDCGRCELTCCAYSVSVVQEEADRIVAAVTEDGRWRRGLFDGSERTGAGRLFRISRTTHADGSLGACTFLEDDRRCQVQRLGGLSAKPVVCRLFPLRPMLTPDGPRSALRPGCPHATPDHSAATVTAFRALLDEAAELRGTLLVPCAPKVVELAGGVSLPWREYAEIEADAVAGLRASGDVVGTLGQVALEVAARSPHAITPLGAAHLERLAGTLAPMLGELHGDAFASALYAAGALEPAALPRRCPTPSVIAALEGAYPLQFPTWLGGLGVVRLLAAAVDRHAQTDALPREVLSAYFRGFRAPTVHIALANLATGTLESLAVTPGL